MNKKMSKFKVPEKIYNSDFNNLEKENEIRDLEKENEIKFRDLEKQNEINTNNLENKQFIIIYIVLLFLLTVSFTVLYVSILYKIFKK